MKPDAILYIYICMYIHVYIHTYIYTKQVRTMTSFCRQKSRQVLHIKPLKASKHKSTRKEYLKTNRRKSFFNIVKMNCHTPESTSHNVFIGFRLPRFSAQLPSLSLFKSCSKQIPEKQRRERNTSED